MVGFTRCLHLEMAEWGGKATSFVPGAARTNFCDAAGIADDWLDGYPDADDFARTLVHCIDVPDNSLHRGGQHLGHQAGQGDAQPVLSVRSGRAGIRLEGHVVAVGHVAEQQGQEEIVPQQQAHRRQQHAHHDRQHQDLAAAPSRGFTTVSTWWAIWPPSKGKIGSRFNRPQ